MRTLHIIQRYPPSIGGSETWCQGLCRYLASQGHEVRVLTLDVYNEDEFWRDPPVHNCTLRFGRLEYDGSIKVIRCKRTKIHPLVFGLFRWLDKTFKIYFYGPHSIEMYLKMFREIKDTDIVHLHTIPYPHNIIAYFIAKIWRKKIVITPYFHPGHPYYERKLHYWLMNRCDTVLALSDYEKDYFIKNGLEERKTFVAYNAINPSDYKPRGLLEFKNGLFNKYNIKPSTKIIVFIGRKVEYKGLDILIDAARKIIKEKDVRFFLVGPDFPWFADFYSCLSREEQDKIINLGVISHQDKVDLLYLSDLFVLPSQFESFGIVFLEAWACGVPVIGTTAGAMPTIIGKSGLVYMPGDVKGLESKIEFLLMNERLAQEMAADGKTKVLTNYIWDKVGSRMLRVYNSLLAA